MTIDRWLVIAQIVQPIVLFIAAKVLGTVHRIERKLDTHDRILASHTRRLRQIERRAS